MHIDVCTSFFAAVSHKQGETTPPALALEGQSYAGKSTALAALQLAGYGVVREYSELRKDPEYQTTHSPHPGEALSPEQAREDFLLYVRIEQRRYQEYLRLKDRHHVIFLDRSIFTLLAYRFAIDIPAAIFAWAVETVLHAASMLFPHHILYIDLPLCLVKQRHHQAGDHLPAYFMDEMFYERFRSFFLALHTSMPTRITIIDGSGTAEATLRQIHAAVQARGFLLDL